MDQLRHREGIRHRAVLQFHGRPQAREVGRRGAYHHPLRAPFLGASHIHQPQPGRLGREQFKVRLGLRVRREVVVVADGETEAKVQRDVDVEVNGKRFSVKVFVPESQAGAVVAGGAAGGASRPRRSAGAGAGAGAADEESPDELGAGVLPDLPLSVL